MHKTRSEDDSYHQLERDTTSRYTGRPVAGRGPRRDTGTAAKQAGYRTRHQERSGRATDPLGVDLHPGNIRDTSNCGTLLGLAEVPANFPRASLRHLALRVLGRRVQTRRPHCPVEDAAVIMELYKAVENEWERQNSLH